MPSLVGCNQDLLISIEGIDGIADLVFSVADNVRVNGSVRSNQSPIPNGQTSIDHIVRNADIVSFTGIYSCSGCNVRSNELIDVLAVLKKHMSKQVYDATFVTLFWNHGSASNMILKSYSTSQNQSDVQSLLVRMSFEAANIQGEIAAPSFRAGGILG